MKLRALLLAALIADLAILVLTSAPVSADSDVCAEHRVGVGNIPVYDGSVCTQASAYVCVPRNKQGDFTCTAVMLWCWCPGPVIA
jgi:hypothetical protein